MHAFLVRSTAETKKMGGGGNRFLKIYTVGEKLANEKKEN
jgi:hypothetical protein